jgi:hypothetical protein
LSAKSAKEEFRSGDSNPPPGQNKRYNDLNVLIFSHKLPASQKTSWIGNPDLLQSQVIMSRQSNI